MDRHCPRCGKDYWRTQQWIHDKCAINTDAINGSVAINREPEKVQAVVGSPAKEDSQLESSVSRTPNRRARADYNAYMKEYMRKRRESDSRR